MADLSLSATTERQLLPPITMVFAAVEDGKKLVHKKEQQAMTIHNILSRVIHVGAPCMALPLFRLQPCTVCLHDRGVA